ncbi:hypothetical protein, partial [Aeromonas salmonicida]|uniref:hypothetical protein n=1 Tax=Aeromonas salmonicida TaxID=645 RepID=UPI0019D62C6B
INPESERATVDQRPVVLRPIGDGVKRFTHDADLRGMVVLRSLGFQLVPFKLHRFRKQRPAELILKGGVWMATSAALLRMARY